jgi:predicted transcriptional regulator YdeE
MKMDNLVLIVETSGKNSKTNTFWRGGTYQKIIAKGKIPYCITDAWNDIWNSDIERAYKTDFEVYDARSKDWSNGEVDIYVSVFQSCK